MRKALLLAPMASELKPLLRYSRAVRSDPGIHTARVGEVELLIARLGVGPAVAFEVTSRLLRLFAVDHVIVSGIAGGLDPDLGVGSVVVPEAALDISTGRCFRASSLGDLTPSGLVGVSDRLVTDVDQLMRLQARGVVALEMETSGVAAACEAAGVAWTAIRVIGDRPDQGLTDEAVMSFLRSDGTIDSMAAIRFMLARPARVPGLARLARDSSAAASKAARVALGALGWKRQGI